MTKRKLSTCIICDKPEERTYCDECYRVQQETDRMIREWLAK